jgi:hypothetical protein
MRTIHCSLSYHKLGSEALDTFATGVKDGINGHPALFTNQPVSTADFGTIINTYTSAYSAYKLGGVNQKPAYTTAHTALMNALNTTADYIDNLVKNNQPAANATIIAGGYVPTKSGSTSVPTPPTPINSTVIHGNGHGIIVTDTPVTAGATFYGCICTVNTPLANYQFANGALQINAANANTVIVNVNSSRKKTISGLTVGTMCFLQFYAGNSNGVSALSDTISIMVV